MHYLGGNRFQQQAAEHSVGIMSRPLWSPPVYETMLRAGSPISARALGRTGAGKMDGMNKLTLEPNSSAVAFTSGTTAR